MNSISSSISNKWVKRFLVMAKDYAAFSKDPSTKVGAIVAYGNDQLSQGYNGLAANMYDDEMILNNREKKLAFIQHAEYNAIFKALRHNTSLAEATIYVTAPPCMSCMKLINSADIFEVVYLAPSDDFKLRYEREIELMYEFAQLTGIVITEVGSIEDIKVD